MPVLPTDDFGQRIQALRPGTPQTLPIIATCAVSAPFGMATTVVRLTATAPCFFAFGRALSASASSHYLPAGAPEYFRVEPGEAVAVIRVSGDGALYLSEMQ